MNKTNGTVRHRVHLFIIVLLFFNFCQGLGLFCMRSSFSCSTDRFVLLINDCMKAFKQQSIITAMNVLLKHGTELVSERAASINTPAVESGVRRGGCPILNLLHQISLRNKSIKY